MEFSEHPETEIEAASLAYLKTGEIPELLLPGFDQHGRWIQESPTSEFVSACARARLQSIVLADFQRSTINADGEHILLTSCIINPGESAEIPWHEIRGLIRIETDSAVIAPNLRRISSYDADIDGPSVSLPELRTATRITVSADELAIPFLANVGWAEFQTPNLTAPSLRTAGNLELGSSQTADLPALQTVDLGIRSYSLLKFRAPNLETINSKTKSHFGLVLPYTTVFYAPKLRVSGKCKVNPHVLDRLAAALLRRTMEIEI